MTGSAKKVGKEADDAFTPRVRQIRQAFFEATPSVSIERAKATTEVYKKNPGLPHVLLRAKAFYRACETIPINISEGELIVGHPAGKRRAGVFCPEISWRWVRDELDTIHEREQDPYVIGEEDKKTLKEEIFPFWEGKSVDEYVYGEIEELGLLPLTFNSGVIDGELKNTNGAGEISVGLGTILLQKGFKGIKKDAERSLKKFDPKNAEDIEKIYFLKAVMTTCDGMVLFSRRYAELAKKLAQKEKNETRRKELEHISKTCQRVPGEPAKSFQEALQSIWFGQVALFLEENAPSYSPGRVDQYLYPFFKRDIDSGVLTPEEARELICCWLIKYAEVPWLLSQFVSLYYAGYMGFQNMNLGGQTRDGKDATNELSYMILDSVKNLKMYQPSLSVRVHNNSPQEFLLKVGEVVRTGIGFPAVHFDDTTIKMMLSYGVSMEDARDYCVLGCVEPSIHGKLSQWSACCLTNFPIAVEFA
jgi:formate C-acetyltransferase